MSLFKSSYTAKTDEELMILVTKGSKGAFNEIYKRYSSKLLYYINRLLNNDSEKAQDFLHDLFIKIIEKPHLFDPDKKFSTWVYTIATNLCRNEYRKRARRTFVTFDNMPEFADVLNVDYIEKIDGKSFVKSLREELSKLKDSHRTTFILRYQEQLQLQEIAEIMDCSIGTVKSRLFYTIRKLADKLEVFDPNKYEDAYEK